MQLTQKYIQVSWAGPEPAFAILRDPARPAPSWYEPSCTCKISSNRRMSRPLRHRATPRRRDHLGCPGPRPPSSADQQLTLPQGRPGCTPAQMALTMTLSLVGPAELQLRLEKKP